MSSYGRVNPATPDRGAIVKGVKLNWLKYVYTLDLLV